MRFFLADGHNVVAFPEGTYERLRTMIPPQYDIIAAHQRTDGRLVAWCKRRDDDEMLKFAEGMVRGNA